MYWVHVFLTGRTSLHVSSCCTNTRRTDVLQQAHGSRPRGVTEPLRCQRPHRCGILGCGARAQGVHLHGKGVLIMGGDTGREGGAHG